MRFEQPLIEGTLIRRQKRFLAHVKLRSGEEVTAHCAHPGSMQGCSDPGSRVLLSSHADPRRRFQHQLEIIYSGRTPVGVHTGRPTTVVSEAILQGRIPELAGYAKMRRVPRVKRAIHVDFVLEGNGLRTCHIAVENVTMAKDGVAYYPDSVTMDGIQDMATLTDLVREGHRAMVFFVVQRADAERWRPADEIDGEFGQAFRDAVARGVETICHRAKVSRKGIELDKRLDVELGA